MLKSLLPVFEDKARENVLILLNQYISTESSISTKKSLQLKQTQLAFAIKPGLSGLLDVARATFCETVEEIHQVRAILFFL